MNKNSAPLHTEKEIEMALTILDEECRYHQECKHCPLYQDIFDNCLLKIFPQREQDKKFTTRMVLKGLEVYAQEHPEYEEVLEEYKKTHPNL